MTTPRVEYLRQLDTHRLIPARHSGDDASVLLRIADNEQHLQGVLDLDSATDARLRAENDLLPGIGIDELVFGIPHHRIINAAFTHAHPFGSRFNGPERGAWYAGFELETSQAEVAWHKSVEFSEIGWFQESVTYDDYLADFAGEYHDIRTAPAFASSLDPDSYAASQALAEILREAGSPPESSIRACDAKAAFVSPASDPHWSATFGGVRATALRGRERRNRPLRSTGPARSQRSLQSGVRAR